MFNFYGLLGLRPGAVKLLVCQIVVVWLMDVWRVLGLEGGTRPRKEGRGSDHQFPSSTRRQVQWSQHFPRKEEEAAWQLPFYRDKVAVEGDRAQNGSLCGTDLSLGPNHQPLPYGLRIQ